jgi:hypothetical protein
MGYAPVISCKRLKRKVHLPLYKDSCPFPIGWQTNPHWLLEARVSQAYKYALRRMGACTFGSATFSDCGAGI